MSAAKDGEKWARASVTDWSLVGRAGRGDAELRRAALEQLLKVYLPALSAHLVHRRGLAPDRADDLLQEFVVNKIVEKDLIGRADRDLGKFRTFLLTALDRFIRNKIRDEKAKKRAPDAGALVEFDDRANWSPTSPGPSAIFDVTWAREVISEAMRRMRSDCETSGRTDLWGVFECRVVGPTFEGARPVGYEELVKRFAFQSPSQASNALTTAKRMYARALRSVVAQYARDDGEIELEIDELREVLARSGA